jgi:peptidyl-prolyl cis-trans isomerase B (cyclophilin B)
MSMIASERGGPMLYASAPMQEGADRRWIILAVFALIAVGVVGAILIGRSGGEDDDGAASAAGLEGCEEVDAAKPKRISLKAPKQTVGKGEDLTAVVATSCGSFEIALDTSRAPKTVNSFAHLADEGFYDGLGFHRIAPGFVIQGGDPLGTGVGGPGYTIDEKPPANLAYTKGTVAMAKSSADPPGRSGSQFYVVTAPDAGLPPEYALVGKVSEGYDTVARIEKLGTPAEQPKQPVLIETVTIERG